MLKVLKPSTPTFVSSTVAEPASSDPASAWSDTSAYAAGDTVYVAGTEHRIYESLAAHQSVLANTTGTATMTIAAPCVVTWGSAAQVDGTEVVFSTNGALPTGLTVGTKYYVKNRSGTTFNLTATYGGTTLITTTGTQSGTHTCKTTSTVPSTRLTGTDPLWLDLGPTNRHAMFDTIISTGTEQTAGETVTMTIASPCVVTWNTHGLPNGSTLTLSTTGALPTGLTVGTTYYVVGAAANTFNLAATLGGTAINTTGSQSGTHTAIADLCVVVSPGICNGVAVLDVANVSSVKCEMFNGSTFVYTETQTVDDTFISDWYAYCFEPYAVLTDLIFGPLPPYPNATVKLTFTPTSSGVTINCGVALYGNTVEIGNVEYGATAGITDYSRKETDQYGITTLVERGFSKHTSYNMQITNQQLRRVFSTLAALRATPAVWIASDDYKFTPLTAFGYPKDWGINVQYADYSAVSLEIEGMQ
jgi:hypothetical protein